MNNKKNIEDIYPLSPMQQGILFQSILNPESDIYITQVCLNIEGNIDSNNIRQTWQKIVDRHQALRATFRWEKNDKTFQAIYKQVELPWQEKDWREYSLEEQDKLLEEYLIKDKKQGFDLKRSPLMRIALIRLTETTYQLIWTQHHLILDGWSSSLILKEFFTIYNGLQCQRPIPYGQYIAWLKQQDLERAKTYWQNLLRGFSEPTYLKVYGQELEQVSVNKSKNIELTLEISNKLKSLAQQYNLTLNTIIQGAFALLLSRYTDNKDIVYGLTTSGRSGSLSGIESMTGLFINTIPIRIKSSDTELLLPWLNKLQQQQIENLQYEYTPLVTIQDLSEISQGIALFENIFVFENYPVDTKTIAQNKKLKVTSIDISESNNFPLTCLVKAAAKIAIELQYKSDRFEGNTIAKILKSFEYILTQIINNPEGRLGQISILLPAEKELIKSWQQTGVDYSLDKTIPELFSEQVNKTPEAIALVFETKKYTYQQLDSYANQLANYLRELGVREETPVGIYLERSEKMAIAILAIIKAGGAYVPLEPIYPENRIDFIVEDTEINIILTEARFAQKIKRDNLNIIDLNYFFSSDHISSVASTSPTSLNPDNAAYIIYTSGSTGKPKGVINTHRSLTNRLLWMQDAYQLNSQDKVLQKTPFSFDVSVWEFFWTWLNGACLVIAKPEGQKDSNYLVKLIIESKITVIHFVPSMLEIFLEESNISSCKSLKKVICSGEALSVNTKNKFLEKLDAELHNLYGPTEAAIDVTAYQCHSNSKWQFAPTISIGKAIANTQIYILNSQQQINPIGVPGELCIGGVGLSRGYIKRPDLTAEKFIPNPFSVISKQLSVNSFSPTAPTATLYKTGDKACYLHDGNIQFLGRIDNNVKIRGFRIELGEIEAVLEQNIQVQKSIVIIRKDLGINPQIVAYLTGDRYSLEEIKQDLVKSKLRHYLELQLPYYMIPDVFVFLSELPLNINGKINRQALPKPEIQTKTFIAPRNDLEKNIATIWQEVLQIEKVSIDDNLFELGGNSLSATRINSRLKESLSIDLPLRTIFEKPTILGIAERVKLMKIVLKEQLDISNLKNRKDVSPEFDSGDCTVRQEIEL